jgi:hypothetical protein
VDDLTEAEHLMKAAEFDERARTTFFPEIAAGCRTIADSHRTMARIVALKARLAADPLVPI